ncbi:hypothetical protein OESDEN_09750, partial [Oesophagostomum dentatum]
MTRQSSKKTQEDNAQCDGMPLWASKLIESGLVSFRQTQNMILTRLSKLEEKIDSRSFTDDQQSLLHSTVIKIRADDEKINEKSEKITWVGIGEQATETSTRRFDHEIIKEAVYTSGDQELIQELEEGHITHQRFPPGKPRKPGQRGRIIKVTLLSQALRDRLLTHMRSSKQSLTKPFTHSYARRDYTIEELKLDRYLRKQAGDVSAQSDPCHYVISKYIPLRTIHSRAETYPYKIEKLERK